MKDNEALAIIQRKLHGMPGISVVPTHTLGFKVKLNGETVANIAASWQHRIGGEPEPERWTIKGPRFPKIGRTYGEGRVWRAKLEDALDAAIPHLRPPNAFEIARAATAKVHWAMRYSFPEPTDEDAALLAAVAASVPPSMIHKQAAERFRERVAEIELAVMTRAALEGALEMWNHFDWSREGAPR